MEVDRIRIHWGDESICFIRKEAIEVEYTDDMMEVENIDYMMELDWEFNWKIDKLDFIETNKWK